MFKDVNTDEFMYPIIGFDDFSISRSGKVAKCLREPGNCDTYQRYIPIKPFIKNKKLVVRIPNNEGEKKVVSVAKLNLYSIYGELPFKVGYVDNNPLNVDQKNLYYKFSKYTITESINVENTTHHGKFLLLTDDKNRCEVFKPLPEEYIRNNGILWISSKGVVFDLYRKCLITRTNDFRGYYKIGIHLPFPTNGKDNWQAVTLKVHSLVYAAWVDTDLRGMTIDHVDGRRHNNDVLNLEKVTLEENVRRAHDRNINVPAITTSKWTTQQVHLVCQMLERGCIYKEIAEALGFNASDKTSKEYKSVANLCKAIRDGRTYKDISCQYKISDTKSTVWKTDYKTPTKFNKDIIREVCEWLSKVRVQQNYIKCIRKFL